MPQRLGLLVLFAVFASSLFGAIDLESFARQTGLAFVCGAGVMFGHTVINEGEEWPAISAEPWSQWICGEVGFLGFVLLCGSRLHELYAAAVTVVTEHGILAQLGLWMAVQAAVIVSFYTGCFVAQMLRFRHI